MRPIAPLRMATSCSTCTVTCTVAWSVTCLKVDRKFTRSVYNSKYECKIVKVLSRIREGFTPALANGLTRHRDEQCNLQGL